MPLCCLSSSDDRRRVPGAVLPRLIPPPCLNWYRRYKSHTCCLSIFTSFLVHLLSSYLQTLRRDVMDREKSSKVGLDLEANRSVEKVQYLQNCIQAKTEDYNMTTRNEEGAKIKRVKDMKGVKEIKRKRRKDETLEFVEEIEAQEHLTEDFVFALKDKISDKTDGAIAH